MKLPNFTRPPHGVGEHNTIFLNVDTDSTQEISPTFDKLNEIEYRR